MSMLFHKAGVVGLSLTLSWWAVSPSYGQPAVPTYEIKGEDCSGSKRREGSGFLAEDWTGTGKQVLLTSLHVIDSCRSLKVNSIECVGMEIKRGKPMPIPAGRTLLVWPSHDLVAIPISEGSPLGSSQNVPPGRLELKSLRPDEGADIVILGRNSFSFCPKANGQIENYLKVADHAKRLADVLYSTPKAMQGSLDSEAIVMIYTSNNVGPGTSGAPVLVRRGENLIFGIHIAGYKGKPIGWSILLDRVDELLEEPILYKLGDTPWPAYDAPGLQQALYDHLTPESEAAVFAYQQEQLAAYKEVTELLKGFTYWAREVLIRYDRYAGDAARLDRAAREKMNWANEKYEPYAQQINTGDADVLRARLTTLWGPMMALRYNVLFEEAVAIHKGAMFPTSEINQLIRDASTSTRRREKKRKIEALEERSRELRQAYEPQLDSLQERVEQFMARLEKGLRQLGLTEAIN